MIAMIAVRAALAYQRMVSPITETVLFVFGLVALGYAAGWSGYLKAQTGDGLSEFAVGVAMPLLLVPHHDQRRFPWRSTLEAVGGVFHGRHRGLDRRAA